MLKIGFYQLLKEKRKFYPGEFLGELNLSDKEHQFAIKKPEVLIALQRSLQDFLAYSVSRKGEIEPAILNEQIVKLSEQGFLSLWQKGEEIKVLQCRFSLFYEKTARKAGEIYLISGENYFKIAEPELREKLSRLFSQPLTEETEITRTFYPATLDFFEAVSYPLSDQGFRVEILKLDPPLRELEFSLESSEEKLGFFATRDSLLGNTAVLNIPVKEKQNQLAGILSEKLHYQCFDLWGKPLPGSKIFQQVYLAPEPEQILKSLQAEDFKAKILPG